jgi:CRISPR/Cas system-associated endonuclease/helicase Cas3
MYLAHSSIVKENGVVIPEQSYYDHIKNVQNISIRHLTRIKPYVVNKDIYDVIEKVVILSATYHDLGKLIDQAQRILKGETQGAMINHVSAGVIYLLKEYSRTNKLEYLISAYLVKAHHIGLLNFNKIIDKAVKTLNITYKPANGFKDDRSCSIFGLCDIPVDSYCEQHLPNLLTIHNSLVEEIKINDIDQKKAIEVLTNFILLRVCLAILCDADHEDTSLAYKEPYPQKSEKLKSKERKKILVDLINKKSKNNTERNIMRNEMFDICSHPIQDNFVVIDGTVGSGKTYSSLVYALDISEKKDLDSINVVLPYISLIEQTTETYRDAIGLNEKDKLWSISPIHSICESKNLFHRKFYKNYNSPINVSTSVNFFKILTCNKIPVLKNIHKFIGSVIIMDEYHSYAKYEFWPVILSILEDFSKYFEIKFCFCSGSPTEYWNLNYNLDNYNKSLDVKSIIPKDFYKKMLELEKNRVNVCSIKNEDNEFIPLSFDDLKEKIDNLEGSIFIVLDTRIKGNRLFNYLSNDKRKIYLRYSASAPKDRERQLLKIKEDLNNDRDIILIATEGSDVGLDISFRHGFKEYSSTHSALQIAGRINRNCEYLDSKLFIFELEKNPDGNGKLNSNPALKSAKEVFLDIISSGIPISPELCTDAEQKNIFKYKKSSVESMEEMYNAYYKRNYEDLDSLFNIINVSTIKILTDKNVYNKIIEGDVKWHDIQESIVTIYDTEKNREKYSSYLKPIIMPKLNEEDDSEETDLYFWNGLYDRENEGIMLDPVFKGFPANGLIV